MKHQGIIFTGSDCIYRAYFVAKHVKDVKQDHFIINILGTNHEYEIYFILALYYS